MSKTTKINPIRDNIYFFDKETHEKKSKYDKISRDLRYVLRANNPDKSLSKGARLLATNYFDMISKSENGILFVTHDFISNISEVGNRQNNNLHRELVDLFYIQYNQSVIIDGKKYRDGFTIKFTENTEIILKNPKLFYSIQTEKNFHLDGKKFPPRRKKISTPLYIDKENPIEKQNRSINLLKNKSENFNKKNPEEKSNESNFKNNILEKIFTLKDFYPLSKEDCYQLQQLSKRSFTQRAMNEILLDMSRRVPAIFYSKKRFLNYFSKSLANELREVGRTDNETFRIKANITPEEREEKEIDKYLQEIEYSLHISPEWHFRKKIAGGTLLPRKAFNFLKAYKAIDVQGSIAKIYLYNEVELSETDLKIILAQVKASHETTNTPQIQEIQLITPHSSKKVKDMLNINEQILDSFGSVRGEEILKICDVIQRPDKAIQVQVKDGEEIPENDKHLLRQCIKTVYGGEVTIRTNPPVKTNVIKLEFGNDNNWSGWETRADVWEKFKKGILEQLRSEEGEHIFNAWFDKLQRVSNPSDNQLTLTGRDFYISYISQNYSHLIEKTVKSKKINVTLAFEEQGYRPIVFTPTQGRR